MNIKKEMRSNEDIFRIKCDKCDNTYFDKCNLVRHYKLDHLKWTKCQLCGAISKDSKKHLAKFCAVKFPENREKEEKSIKYKILLNKKRGRTSDIVLDSSLENKKAENDNSIKNEVIMNENNDAKSDKVIITKMDSFCYRNMKNKSHKDFSNQFDYPVEKYFMNNSIYNTSSFSYLGIAKKSSKEKKVNYNTENENVDIDEKNANNIVNIKEKNKEEPCENEQKIKANNQNNNSKYNVNDHYSSFPLNYSSEIIYSKKKNNNILDANENYKNELNNNCPVVEKNNNKCREIKMNRNMKDIIFKIIQKFDLLNDEGMLLLIEFIEEVNPLAISMENDFLNIDMTKLEFKDCNKIYNYIREKLLNKYKLSKKFKQLLKDIK